MAKQSPDAGETFRRKPHRQLELIIPFQNIWIRFAPPEILPTDETVHPGEMAVDRDGEVAAMEHPGGERLAH